METNTVRLKYVSRFTNELHVYYNNSDGLKHELFVLNTSDFSFLLVSNEVGLLESTGYTSPKKSKMMALSRHFTFEASSIINTVKRLRQWYRNVNRLDRKNIQHEFYV